MFEYYNKFSDLWNGEQKIIAEIASSVPDNGTIVEIGTFQGGTSRLFYDATNIRKVKTYTVDIRPLPIAYENLKNTNVEIINKSSMEVARSWNKLVGRPIDLLFIDGMHRFENVFEDFNAWINLLSPGGTIIFHDYDPIERGGFVHLGVKICVDSILRKKILNNHQHNYKLLYGSIKEPGKLQLTAKDCCETFTALGDEIVHLRDLDYSGWTLVADDRFSLLINGCLNTEKMKGPVLASEITNLNNKYLVSPHPMGLPLQVLWEKGINKNSIKIIDSLKTCYIVYQALKKNFSYLHNISSNQAELMRWAETLEMIEHAYESSFFPDNVRKQVNNINVKKLSKLISQEQIKLSILARIVKTFVNWNP